jgi:transglutaminase-like putative cysteine protease
VTGNLTTGATKRQSERVNIPTLQAYEVGNSLAKRVRILRDLLWSPNSGLQNPQVLAIARRVTSHCPGRDGMCELQAIYQFVVQNVRYTGDISKVDTFAGPLRVLQMGGGDCDEHSLVNAALAMANGFDAKVRITSNRGQTWDHIYCMVGFPKGRTSSWIALDSTMAKGRNDFSRFGKEPPRAKFQDFKMEKP